MAIVTDKIRVSREPQRPRLKKMGKTGIPVADAMVIDDPELLVSYFEFQGVKADEVEFKVKAEIVSLLSMPIEEIDMDYQILGENGKDVAGVYACLPLLKTDKYFSRFQKQKIAPTVVTTPFLNVLNRYLQSGAFTAADAGRLCFLDFSQGGKLHIALFHRGVCEHIREVRQAHADDLHAEIVRSIRNVLAHSSDKGIGRFVCHGGETIGESIVRPIAARFEAQVEFWSPGVISSSVKAPYFQINLAKRHVLTPRQRRNALYVLWGVTALCSLLILMLSITIVRNRQRIQRISQELSALTNSNSGAPKGDRP